MLNRSLKPHYCCGDRVILYLEPLHEGMHPDDAFDDRPREAVVLEVHTYLPPNVRYNIMDFTDEEILELTIITAYTVHHEDEDVRIEPGSIARKAD